jgi:hypothetical protein
MLKNDYVEAKPIAPLPVRVSHKSELLAALRQRARSIVIEDQELARPFVRLLRTRELSWMAGELPTDTMLDWISRTYKTDIKAQWYMGRYVLPGNVQKVILKPKRVSQDNDETDVMRHHYEAGQALGAWSGVFQ